MSLSKISTGTVVKNQFQYKLKANVGVFTSLVFLQILGLLFSLGGNGSGTSYTGSLEVSYTMFNTMNIYVFTFLWAFVQSIMMTTKTDWQNGFSFVGNRFTNDVSNIVFLLFASIVAGILTVLTAFVLRVFVYYVISVPVVNASLFILTPGDVAVGVLTMVLFLVLFCSIGYFLGTLTRTHRLMPFLLPVLIIGLLIILTRTNLDVLHSFYKFYFEEPSIFLFIVKMVVTFILLFGLSITFSRRTEVRR